MTCKHRAVLIVTRSVKGTSSNVAKARIDLRCGRSADHQGPHRDLDHDESWEGRDKNAIPHLVRHESEEE